jgi:hypothetical protein
MVFELLMSAEGRFGNGELVLHRSEEEKDGACDRAPIHNL